MAILCGVAAGIHLGAAPQHFAEWWGYGAFFLVAAVGECALVALLALRPRAWVVQAGIWASLATMLMYLLSRTSGIPLGPRPASSSRSICRAWQRPRQRLRSWSCSAACSPEGSGCTL